jgi:hypothetical protein
LDENHALTGMVIGLAMKVHRAFGSGFLEPISSPSAVDLHSQSVNPVNPV